MRLLRYLVIVSAAMTLGSCGSEPPTQPTSLTVASITPSSGSTLGGIEVTITGTNFSGDATVTIGGVPATALAVSGPTRLTAITGQHASGVVDVVVMAAGRTGRLPGGFTYMAPAAVANTPPRILSLSARGTRFRQPSGFADLDEQIDVTAVVEDTETSTLALTYEWTSNAGGTFSGSGASVKWRAPLSPPLIPINVTLTLTVIERYTTVDDTGLPAMRENRVTRTVDVSVHDSKNEVADMARQFLLDFSDSRIKDVPTILRNFTDDLPACEGGKNSEGLEIANNRKNFFITSSTVGNADVTFNFQGICPVHSVYGDACAFIQVDWRSTNLSTNLSEHVRGTDQVSAVYLPAQSRWRLCGSDFDGALLPNRTHLFIR